VVYNPFSWNILRTGHYNTVMSYRYLLAVALLAAASVVGQPRLEIVGNRFDFGITPQNGTLVQFFWFKSIGTDTVRITKLTTGCDCATMPLPRDWIAPGDSMEVGLFWHTERKVGNSGRYPYVFTNAGEDPSRIYLTANVALAIDSAQPLSIKPYRVELSRLPSMSLDTATIFLTNRTADSIQLAIVSNPVKEVRIDLPAGLAAGETVKCRFAVAPEYRDIDFERSITVLVSGGQENQARYTIPIRRKIYGN